MDTDVLLKIARLFGLIGIGLLVLSGIGGTLLASRTAQKIKWLKGKTFTYHRTTSLVGAALFLLHPIPMVLAHDKTGLDIASVLIPFIAPKQNLLIGLGILAAYALIVVTISSLYIKRLKRGTWRSLHYLTYATLFLGLAHGLFISGEFKAGETFEWEEPEKVMLLLVATTAVLFPLWRVIAVRRKIIPGASSTR